MVEREAVLNELEKEDLSSEAVEQLMRALNRINRALDLPEEVSDPLIDEWERDLAEGRIPDLEKQISDA